MKPTEGDVNYYEVEPKGFVYSLLAGDLTGAVGGSGRSGGAVAAEGGPGGTASEGRNPAFWALIGIAGLILVMIVAIIVLMMGEGSSAVSPPTTEVASAITTSTTEGDESPAVIIPPTTQTTLLDTTGPTVYTNPMNNPVRIVIPAISAAANIIPVGIEKEGVMQVPPAQKAGWYKLGPVPGASGPSVIVAHVYYNHERDVFYNLKRLEPGDEIQVYDGSGDVAIFVVDSKEEVLKNQLPADKIWNKTNEPLIRLITCGGVFDPTTRHFLSNVIVYGHLVQ